MGKLKAATILETIIAMLIIFIVFLAAGMILLNISKAGLNEKKIKASAAINTFLDHLKIEEIPSEVSEKSGNFLINAAIESYRDKPGVAQVNCRIYDAENKIIAEQKRIMFIKN